MITVDVTKMSSRGQIVIPQEMRAGYAKGQKFIAVQRDDEILLKPVENVEENFREDMRSARRVLERLERKNKKRIHKSRRLR